MKINFLNVDEFCKNLPAVTSNKLYASKKGFNSNGLFSEEIFGPVRNYTCACGIYHGRSKVGAKCEICKVEITNSNERRKRLAKIQLPFPVVNPIMYYLLIRAGKVTLKNVLNDLLLAETTIKYRYDKDLERYVVVPDDTEVEPNTTIYTGIKGAYQICKEIAEKEKDSSNIWKYIYSNLDKFYMNNVIVLPPAYRPTSKTKDVQKRDKLNDYLLTILNFTLIKNQELSDSNLNETIALVNQRNLQKHVFELYEYIITKLSKKSGLIRNSILGKRNDFSGRAVIVPEPTLELDQCGVPYLMLLELYKLEIANLLNEKRILKTYHSAISYVDDCIKRKDYSLYKVIQYMCSGKYVILNRQPTLHRMGILAFKIVVNDKTVIQLHPMACEPYNADFDGDQMAIYRALYPEAEKECGDVLSITKNLISPSTGNLMIGVNQDIVLGLYLLTLPDEKNKTTLEQDSGNKIETYLGRVKFNECLPNGYAFINSVIDKPMLTTILNDISRNYSYDQIKKCLDKVKDLGLKSTTIFGSTISIKGLKLENVDEILDSIFDDDTLTISQKINKLKSEDTMTSVKKAFGYSDFIKSGSRGSWDQARQVVLCRGYISNSKGDIIPEPIKSSFVHGLNKQEFFSSSYGTRKGLLDTALNTGVSGYLTRKLIYAAVNLELSENIDDCGTTDYLTVKINNRRHARSFIGRFYLNEENKLEEITYKNYPKIEKKIIKIRSPIFCESPNICKKCYGSTSEYIHTKYIGILAAQALGEVGTQLVLRTFHVSGIAQTKTSKLVSSLQEDIISDLTKVKTLLHRSTKESRELSYSDLVEELYDIYVVHRNILYVHFECIVSQMMRKDGKRWRLLKNRNSNPPELLSILSIPQQESWLLALAFQKPKEYIIDGILHEIGDATGFVEKIMTNQSI